MERSCALANSVSCWAHEAGTEAAMTVLRASGFVVLDIRSGSWRTKERPPELPNRTPTRPMKMGLLGAIGYTGDYAVALPRDPPAGGSHGSRRRIRGRVSVSSPRPHAQPLRRARSPHRGAANRRQHHAGLAADRRGVAPVATPDQCDPGADRLAVQDWCLRRPDLRPFVCAGDGRDCLDRRHADGLVTGGPGWSRGVRAESERGVSAVDADDRAPAAGPDARWRRPSHRVRARPPPPRAHGCDAGTRLPDTI